MIWFLYLSAVELVCKVFDALRPAWVRVNASTNLTQPQIVVHAGRQRHNKFTGGATYSCRSQYLVSALFSQNFEHTRLTLTMSSIKSLVELCPGVILLCQIMCIFANVRELWLCVGCPGQPGLSTIDLFPE